MRRASSEPKIFSGEVPTLHCAILCPSRFGSFQVMLSGIGRYSPPRGAQAEVESESGDWIWEVTPGLQAFGMQGMLGAELQLPENQ